MRSLLKVRREEISKGLYAYKTTLKLDSETLYCFFLFEMTFFPEHIFRIKKIKYKK